MSHLGVVGAVLACLTACGISEKGFPKQYASAVCKYADKCSKAYFNEEYDNQADCRDELEDYFDADDYEDCDFDSKKARACLKSLDEATRKCDYDDFYDDSCGEVWDCGRRRDDSGDFNTTVDASG